MHSLLRDVPLSVSILWIDWPKKTNYTHDYIKSYPAHVLILHDCNKVFWKKEKFCLPVSTLKIWIISIIPAAILEPDGCQDREMMRPMELDRQMFRRFLFSNKETIQDMHLKLTFLPVQISLKLDFVFIHRKQFHSSVFTTNLQTLNHKIRTKFFLWNVLRYQLLFMEYNIYYKFMLHVPS